MTINFPFSNNNPNSLISDQWNLLTGENGVLSNLLSDFFEIIYNLSDEKIIKQTIRSIDCDKNQLTLRFLSYSDIYLKDISFKPCLNNCYETFGFEPFSTYQNYNVFYNAKNDKGVYLSKKV
jgi:hypothetical protein